MVNLREALAVTSLASLEWSAERERAIDRVAASGKCPPLGLSLWKARYMLEAAAYRNARDGLFKLCRDRYTREKPEILVKLVDQSLHEWLSSACAECNGATEVMAGDLRVICSVCRGSGVKRYSDEERARAMGLSYALVKFNSPRFGWLIEQMSALDRAVNEQMNIELERGIDPA